MTFDDVKNAIAALSIGRRFTVQVGAACSVCTNARVTLRAAATTRLVEDRREP